MNPSKGMEAAEAEIARLREALDAEKELVQRICRESGVVLFQDGEVRNHRAEHAEKRFASLTAEHLDYVDNARSLEDESAKEIAELKDVVFAQTMKLKALGEI